MPMQNAYEGQADQPQTPEIPEPFTTADNLRLQSYNQGMSEAQQQVDEGNITSQEGDYLKQGILHQRQPLLAKQKAAEQNMKNQALKDVQQTNAQAQGMQHSDAVFRAKGVYDRIAPVMHPLTGETAFLFEKSPNQWDQIKWGGVEQSQGEQGGQTYPISAPVPLGDPSANADTSGGNWAGESRDSKNTPQGGNAPPAGGPPETERPPNPYQPPQQRVSAPTPTATPGEHQMEIWNGPNRERVTFDRSGKIINREQFDATGNPMNQQDQQAGPEGTLLPHETSFIQGQAERMVPMIPKPPAGSGPQAMLHWQVAMSGRAHQVAEMAASMAKSIMVRRNQQSGLEGRSGEAMRREAAMGEARQKEHAYKQEQEAKRQQQVKDDFHKVYDQARKNLTTKDHKPTHEEIIGEYKKIKDAHDEMIGVKKEATGNLEAEKNKQAAAAKDLLTKLGIGTGNPPGNATEEQKRKPADLPADRVAKLSDVATEENNKTPATQSGILGELNPFATMSGRRVPVGIEFMLNKAKKEGRTLTAEEAAHYETLVRTIRDPELRKKLELAGE